MSLQVIKILALQEKYAVPQVRHRYLGVPGATVPIRCDSACTDEGKAKGPLTAYRYTASGLMSPY